MILAILSALWLGILTSLSPCPLTTNIAAISYISKNIECPFKTVFSGIFYTFGRVFAYVLLGFIIVGGLLAVPAIANFLQHYINKVLGFLLIFIGLLLLGVFKFGFSFGVKSKNICENLKGGTLIASFVLGIIFALSFCPVSAALFFGSLITLAIEHNSRLLLPLIYGIGTGLPVMLFAVVIAFSAHKVGEMYNSIVKFEYWFKKITGVIFIIAGVFFIATHIIGV